MEEDQLGRAEGQRGPVIINLEEDDGPATGGSDTVNDQERYDEQGEAHEEDEWEREEDIITYLSFDDSGGEEVGCKASGSCTMSPGVGHSEPPVIDLADNDDFSQGGTSPNRPEEPRGREWVDGQGRAHSVIDVEEVMQGEVDRVGEGESLTQELEAIIERDTDQHTGQKRKSAMRREGEQKRPREEKKQRTLQKQESQTGLIAGLEHITEMLEETVEQANPQSSSPTAPGSGRTSQESGQPLYISRKRYRVSSKSSTGKVEDERIKRISQWLIPQDGEEEACVTNVARSA